MSEKKSRASILRVHEKSSSIYTKIGKDDKRLIANIGILYLHTKNMPLNVNSVDCFPLHLCLYVVKCVPPRCIGNYQPQVIK